MKNEQKLLVILTPGFPASESDTNCLPFLQDFVQAINDEQPSLKVIVLTLQYPFTAHEYLWHNNTVISFRGKNRGHIFRRMNRIKIWRKLRSINERNCVVGLFSLWFGECAYVGKKFSDKYNVPHKTWMLGQDAKDGNKYVGKIKPLAKDIIAVSDFIANEFFKNYLIKPAYTIPAGLNDTTSEIASNRNIDILGAGSLIPLKQYHLFIEVVGSVVKSNPKLKSIIAGNGAEMNSLRLLIANFELNANISLAGEIDHKDLLKLMQQTRIFLHTSRYEGFSMVCLEALSAGCHVISFCKPMERDFEHWHVVNDEKEMLMKTEEILALGDLDHRQIFPYAATDTAIEVLKLFSNNVATNAI